MGTIVSQNEVDMITRFRVSDLLSHRKGFTMPEIVTNEKVINALDDLVLSLKSLAYSRLIKTTEEGLLNRVEKESNKRYLLIVTYIEDLERRCGERE
jgi:hypothetical protein